MQEREKIYEIYEEICGARLTTNFGRVGGFERDFNDKSIAKLKKFLNEFPVIMKSFESLFDRNRIFIDRTRDVGPISAADALNYGFTGPCLRAAGVDYDVRAMNPYSSYQEFEFEVPVGTQGDTYDRYLVRNAEIWQSVRLIEQALAKFEKEPKGIYHADVPEFYLPPKENVYNNMEALIYHFKIVMGEGFYLISEGGRSPFRLHFRRPCFIIYQAFSEMVKGQLLSDAIVTMSSLNVIAGELDA
jgi:NADH-quinone oxidoreductase subunit D